MKCLFCNKEKTLTAEHVFPDWMKEIIPEDQYIINQITGLNEKKWQSKPFEHTAKIVCADCNNGWMSDLEADAKPIIKSLFKLDGLELDKDKQEILALWVQKTTLVACHSIPDAIKVDPEVYEELYKNKKPSRKILVNIAWRLPGYEKKEPLGSFYIKQQPFVDVNKEISELLKDQISKGGYIWNALIAIGPLIFVAIGHNMKATLEVTFNRQIYKQIIPFVKNFNWPTEWPTDAEGNLEKIIQNLFR